MKEIEGKRAGYARTLASVAMMAVSFASGAFVLLHSTLGIASQSDGPQFAARILGTDRPVDLKDGKALAEGAVSFAYAGACTTPADVAAMRKGVLGNTSEDGMAGIVSRQRERPAHAPTRDESVELRSGTWSYRVEFTQSKADAQGGVDLTLTGWAKGPDNYDAAAAAKCNGWQPVLRKADIAPVTVHIPAGGDATAHVPVLGAIQLRALTPHL